MGLAGSPETSSVELLLGADGPAVLAAAREAGEGLRAAELLRTRFPADLVAAALTQVDLQARAEAKFPAAQRMLFTRAGLEQASSWRVAAHTAARFASYTRVSDLCTGIGGDLIALASVVRSVLAVDRDPVHLRLAAHNAAAVGLGDRISTWQGDAEDADLGAVDAAFVDPARRAEGRRLDAGAVSPSLSWCFELGTRLPVAVKAAPGIEHRLVPAGWELEFVAEGTALKESVLWSPRFATAGRRATVLDTDGEHTMTDAGAGPAGLGDVGPYVLDPNPAVTRAGLVAELAEVLDAWQVDPLIAFLSSTTPTPTPYGKWLAVEASLPWNLKALASILATADVGAVDLRRRGLAGDVEDVRKRLRLKGTRRVTVLMTRVMDKPWAIVGTPVG